MPTRPPKGVRVAKTGNGTVSVDLNVLEIPSEGAEQFAPLIIAHGLFGSAKNFNSLGKKLAVGRRVLLVDMRNHGDSPWDDDVSYMAMASDLAEIIKKRCDNKGLVLGHSMGGKATMALALTRPELLAGCIIADIAPVAYAHTHQPYIQAMRAMDLSGIERRSQADPMLADVIPEAPLRAFILQNLVIEEKKARWRLNLVALDEGMADLIGWDSALDKMPYSGPSFFLHGGASEYMTPLLVPRVREVFPRAEIDNIPGAGHWLHAEKPAEFLEKITRWLSATDVSS